MIKNIIIIAFIIGLVILSQQPTVKEWGQNTLSYIEKKADPYASKADNWIRQKAYPIIGGEVEKRKEIISQEIGSEIEIQKEKISENLAEKLKNYFSNIIDSIFFPNKVNQSSQSSQSSSLSDSLNSQNPNLSPELQKCIESCQLPKTQ